MRYVQYFEKRGDKFVEAMGDRGIVILDARNSMENSKTDARVFNGVRRPTYAAFQLLQGDSILRSKPITAIIPLKGVSNENTI